MPRQGKYGYLHLPLLFIWPVLGKVILSEFRIIKKELLASKLYYKWLYILMFLFMCFIGILISKYIYTPTEPERVEKLFHEYLSIALALISFHFFGEIS